MDNVNLGQHGCMQAVAGLLHIGMREPFSIEGVADTRFFFSEDGLYAVRMAADAPEMTMAEMQDEAVLDKEHLCAQFKKITYAFVPKETSESLIYWTRRASRIFSGFLSGKIIDSIIIGCLCYLGMLIFNIEYPLLISVIVGITNILPFFGPFIGAIPSILILLIVNPYSALWFGVFIVILQQIDGNIIGPLILGDSVGIEPLWIMISIVIGGGLFGFAGMLRLFHMFAFISNAM